VSLPLTLVQLTLHGLMWALPREDVQKKERLME
jgi:hypothetical protein